MPWRTNVRCQRFFRTRTASGWFEVERSVAAHQQAPQQQPAVETPIQRMIRISEQQTQRFRQTQRTKIEVADSKLEPSQWLPRVGWAVHLQGLDRQKLLGSIAPIGDDEPVLRIICQSVQRVACKAQGQAMRNKSGLVVLFELNRKEGERKKNKPFVSMMEPDTWARYIDVIQAIVCFAVRTQDWDDQERPPYRLTNKQANLFDELEAIAMDVDAGATTDKTEARLDRICLDAMVEMVDHQFKESEYENILISALAVMGLRPDGGWYPATEYTPKYSAVMKMMRLFVVQQAAVEHEDEIKALRVTMDEEEAWEQSTGLVERVREKVLRFMVASSQRTRPTPMGWIYDTKAYGMTIRATTLADGQVDWQGNRITIGKVRFSMDELCDMIHGLVGEARETMAALLFMPGRRHEDFPQIDWPNIEDDHSESRIGYSFIDDERTQWPVNGQQWLISRIAQEERLQKTWVREGDIPFRVRAVAQYERHVEAFRERLWALMHVTGGQPARGPEILGIRHRNTGDGGIRNVFVHKGLISFVALYHKGFRSSERAKVIHRYVPREVGSLVVWYLWLVLPFWQQVQGVIQGADETSPYIWAKNIVFRQDEASVRKSVPEEDNVIIVPEAIHEANVDTVWDTDKVRRRFQQFTGRLIGSEIHIQAWRHIAIAIARKYLSGAFRADEGEEDDGSGHESEEDDILDLQAGHSTHIAGMVYGLEIQRSDFGTATRRDQFREASVRWHRLLGFRQTEGVVRTKKRPLETWETGLEDARQRRFKRLRQVDIRGQLQQMMGTDVSFRGCQREVIQAIFRGCSPIVQVSGTGGGKSLSFMLPAYCSGIDGVSIVIVPLVALREDMVRRCRESMINVHVWDGSGTNRAASIVLVTPESASSRGFRDFVNRLRSRQQLDRVVVDECHMVLDAGDSFRPELRALGKTIAEWGVQMIFLTATLSPHDEGEFYRVMGLAAGRVTMFRIPTTRTNIRYRVTDSGTESIEDHVCQEVAALSERYQTGKVIVYGGTIERVEELGAMLGCPIYHANVADAAGKTEILRRWMQDGRVIVATNALGVGLDVADIRAVVHAGIPRRLRDYAQESGRGGRDGQPSEAVIICPFVRDGTSHRRQSRPADSMLEFIEGAVCRRLVLGEVMDGRVDRVICQPDEEACDICAPDKSQTIVDEVDISGRDNIEDVEFRAMTRETEWVIEEAKQRRQQAAEEIKKWKWQVEEWIDACVVCRILRQAEWQHIYEDCPAADNRFWADTQEMEKVLEAALFGKKRIEEYGGCQDCGVPQALCRRFEAVPGDEGRFRGREGGECQYAGLMVRVIAAMWMYYEEDMEAVIRVVLAEDGQEVESKEDLWAWMRRRRRWGQLEANGLCWLFHRVICEWV
jgi:superfamily II DNA helicase RecQ